MIDVGVNLTNTRFDKDRDELIARAKSVGITAMLVTGTNIAESHKALQLSAQYPDYLYSTAGVHPHDADNVSDDYLHDIRRLAKHKAVKAIGECGLDFNRNFSTPKQQEKVFAEQISLAAELQLPLFLHQRDAFPAWFQLLSPYLTAVPAMVSHCFTGNADELDQCLSAGMYIGITGWVCDERRGKPLQALIPSIPLDKLMIETDAPYLTPRSIKPKPKSSRNEPAYLPYVIEKLAELYQCNNNDIINATSENARKVFNLGEFQ
ncbi:TatD family hydrolase [Colwellia hornerae]|uniref:YchF/TatD family DNA exonuclease n=1 Tax=Colwellia hornerae TaxID=89402 RepID=A0A5C6Q3Z6_9GAMM|nr:TatD family hydrolase [Colwellia hornerae]TWX58429.1 YchF/TatD family DNA exonuclease [Colwellia hornerae]TWX58665.1 YchF/TatD family DNA exonuclease [Colwellia hornerae]TWX63593.1 YchF/TatD family DNA exonuclease [Colwellia hornerae]